MHTLPPSLQTCDGPLLPYIAVVFITKYLLLTHEFTPALTQHFHWFLLLKLSTLKTQTEESTNKWSSSAPESDADAAATAAAASSVTTLHSVAVLLLLLLHKVSRPSASIYSSLFHTHARHTNKQALSLSLSPCEHKLSPSFSSFFPSY